MAGFVKGLEHPAPLSDPDNRRARRRPARPDWTISDRSHSCAGSSELCSYQRRRIWKVNQMAFSGLVGLSGEGRRAELASWVR
jgi:hypothetical protein